MDNFNTVDSLSHEEKARRFPMNGKPFGVWYFIAEDRPDAASPKPWQVNDFSGQSVDESGKIATEFETYGEAVKFSMSLIEEAEQDIQKAKVQFMSNQELGGKSIQRPSPDIPLMDLVEGIREIANAAYLSNNPERNTRTLLGIVAMADMGIGRLVASLNDYA